MKVKSFFFALVLLSLAACHKPSDEETKEITIPAEQQAGQESTYAVETYTGGIRLNFQMSGITHIELESVDDYAIAGTAKMITQKTAKSGSNSSFCDLLTSVRMTIRMMNGWCSAVCRTRMPISVMLL